MVDFIVIGAMKSGTSSIHRNLMNHPEVGLSHRKEINFFSHYFHRGSDWYRKFLVPEKKITGESSPNYTRFHKFPDTASRMAQTVPDVKLIYIVRDPIDRIVSHVHHNLYRDRIQLKNLERNVLSMDDYVLTSSYHAQIQQYLQYYSLENILILDFADLRDNFEDLMNEVTDFLGISRFDFMNSMSAYNTSEKKYLIKYHDEIHKLKSPLIKKLYHSFFYILNMKIDRPRFSDQLKHDLFLRLQPDISKFRKLINREFPAWKTYNEQETNKDMNQMQ